MSEYVPIIFALDHLYVRGKRVLTVLGTQGDVEYAKDRHGFLWYRFLWDDSEAEGSWKLVAY